jgi:hypothetical protein
MPDAFVITYFTALTALLVWVFGIIIADAERTRREKKRIYRRRLLKAE